MTIIDDLFSGTSRPVVILVGGGELSVSVGPLNGPME